MKTLKQIIFLVLILSLTSCGERYNIYYDSPFPKKNIDLSNVLGNEIILKSGFPDSMLALKIYSNKKYNLIVDLKGDTLFIGKVCKFRGLYYFNERFNDTSYWISAVRIDDNLIYGLNTGPDQMYILQAKILEGKYKKLLKYITPDTTLVKLCIDKKEMKNFYLTCLNGFKPDTIIKTDRNDEFTQEEANIAIQIDPDEYNYISKVYPNPTKGEVIIELQEINKVKYFLNDLNARIIMKGEFTEKKIKIDLSNQPDGLYVMTLTDQSGKEKETIKIIKTK